jgi:prepilin-type processing-associated H-X9-DG protein
MSGVRQMTGAGAGGGRCNERAWSLVEVLIVVAIIGLLTAVSLPGLGAVRARSLRVTCLANLRSLAIASTAYSAEDSHSLLLPVHPAADRMIPHCDGFYDYGGADGAGDVWQGRVGPGGIQCADTRPLNAVLGLDGGQGRPYDVFRCPADHGFDPRADYPDWIVWDPSLRRRSAFETVGTSYWGNAVKGDRRGSDQSGRVTFSFGVFLRPVQRVPAPGEVVLYMEMPALFNMLLLGPSKLGVSYLSLGVDGWHESGPKFNFAFCDGHGATHRVPAGWLPDGRVSWDYKLRESGVRFDCYPDPPIIDLPVEEEIKAVRRTGGLR